MSLSKSQNHSAVAIVNMRLRRARLVKLLNKGESKKFGQMYAKDAILKDPDMPAVNGRKSITEYISVQFEYAKEQGCPKIQLWSTRTHVKGKYIYDIGVYSWSTIRCGRYVHKWAWIKDDYYLISDRFTIESTMPSLLDVNDENAVVTDESKNIS